MDAYIVDAVRTPIGRRGGSLAGHHPSDLGAFVIRSLVERTGIDPAAVDDVILGCVDQIGPMSADAARTCWLAAGYPESVPGVTIDRNCGSSQQAIHFAAQAVASGTADLVLAMGVQHMSGIPIGTATAIAEPFGYPNPYEGGIGWRERYGSQEITQFRGADLIAERWGLGRDELEAFSMQSHERALAAIDAGVFDAEIAAVGDFAADETPRVPNWDKVRSLPTLRDGGTMTAAMASQIADGGAAVLVASERAMEVHGLAPRARIVDLTVVGDDPVLMLTAPIPATVRSLERAGLDLDDIDRIEINEAFASVVLAWERELHPDMARVNVNGGAIALGHPIGATGCRLMTTLLNELERTGGRYGLQTMCEGGGLANATIVERV